MDGQQPTLQQDAEAPVSRSFESVPRSFESVPRSFDRQPSEAHGRVLRPALSANTLVPPRSLTRGLSSGLDLSSMDDEASSTRGSICEPPPSPIPSPCPRWAAVDSALGPEQAQDLRRRQLEELSSEALRVKVKAAMTVGDSPLKNDGQAMLVLGPSAAGKSRVLSSSMAASHFRLPSGALHIDGAIIRDCSEVWQEAKRLASEHGLDGFTDYFAQYAKPAIHPLKESIYREAIASRTNLVIPDTASDLRRLQKVIQKLTQANYELSVVAVVAQPKTCEARGRSRESEDGKKYSSRCFLQSVQALVDVQASLPKGVIVQIFENEGPEPERLTFEQLAERYGVSLPDPAASSDVRT